MASLSRRVVPSIAQLGFARTLATATPQLPIRLTGLEGRYATALFLSAAKSNNLEKVEADLKSLVKLISTDQGVRNFLRTPVLNVAQKKVGVEVIVKKSNYQGLTHQFLNVLAENGRLNQTAKIVNAFSTVMAAHRGEVEALITTATPLDAKLKAQLETALKKNFVTGNQKLSVSAKVDPAILGGVVVQVGDQTIDLSVSTKLTKLNNLLAQSV